MNLYLSFYHKLKYKFMNISYFSSYCILFSLICIFEIYCFKSMKEFLGLRLCLIVSSLYYAQAQEKIEGKGHYVEL